MMQPSQQIRAAVAEQGDRSSATVTSCAGMEKGWIDQSRRLTLIETGNILWFQLPVPQHTDRASNQTLVMV